MQFKDLEAGECFRIMGDDEVLIKISSGRYIRSTREAISKKLLIGEIGTVRILVYPCRCKGFYRILSEEERLAIEALLSGDTEISSLEHIFDWD
jgi:hypothetical protein